MNELNESRKYKIYEMYQSGMCQKEIADFYSISRHTVYRSLIGMEKREKTWGMQKYTDENPNIFEEINTQEKAYWFGFLLADGNITYPKTEKQSRWRLRLFLTEDDVMSIISFKNFIGTNREIERIENYKSTYSGKPICGITINNKQIVKNLIEKGIAPNKSLTVVYPEFLVNTNMERHFVRGYFDGNGNVTSEKRKHSKASIRPCTGFTSGSEIFLKRLMERLSLITKPEFVTDKRKQGGDVRIRNYCNCIPFYHWLYDDATIFLERKKKKFDEILNNQKIKS